MLPGSIFGYEYLLMSKISDELRRAIMLIEQTAADLESQIIYVARPEIFTNGESLDWLYGKLGTIRDHLCISDASTIRVIPGMRNHVFFHALGRRDVVAALGRLERRAPELFFTLASQVNSALRFRHKRRTFAPPFVALQGREELSSAEPEYYKFYLGPYSVEESVDRIVQTGAVDIAGFKPHDMIYVPLTETSTDDAAFLKVLASAVARAFFERSRGVIVRLPFLVDLGGSLADRLRTTLTGLRNTIVPIPSVTATNVFFATEDVQGSEMRAMSASLEMFAHDTFDFWRYSPSFYALFPTLRVAVRRNRHSPKALPAMLTEVTGRIPELIFPPASDRRDTS